MDNKAMFKLGYGLYVLTSGNEVKKSGCIINTAIQVTSTPNCISITVNKQNYTHDLIKETGIFNISVISEEADFSLFTHFGFQSGRDVNKFADFTDYKVSANDTPYITKNTNAYLSGKVKQELDLGTHTMFIADVTQAVVLSDVPTATYDYYQKHIKPQPTEKKDEAKEAGGKTKWRCTVCGYEYEGEELPEDFVCPLCKHGAQDFEKV